MNQQQIDPRKLNRRRSTRSARKMLATSRHWRTFFLPLVKLCIVACMVGVPILLLTHNSAQIPWLLVPTIIVVGVYALDRLQDYFLEAVQSDAAERTRENVEARQEQREARHHGHDPEKIERLREQGVPFHIGNDGEIVFDEKKNQQEHSNLN
ncbi:MAG TPA: hypothetical protein VKQ72_21115 [Aggregatilineales bacterium]|nr:hypothetical protein [Aggregatilineales bacterium]